MIFDEFGNLVDLWYRILEEIDLRDYLSKNNY